MEWDLASDGSQMLLEYIYSSPPPPPTPISSLPFFVIFYLYLCHFFSISLCVCIGISLSFDCTVPLLYFFVTENYTQGGWKITRNPMLLETGDEAIFCGLTSAHPFTPFIEIYLSIYLCIYPPSPFIGCGKLPPHTLPGLFSWLRGRDIYQKVAGQKGHKTAKKRKCYLPSSPPPLLSGDRWGQKESFRGRCVRGRPQVIFDLLGLSWSMVFIVSFRACLFYLYFLKI